MIEVIKDLNLENTEGNDDQGLANLELLLLAGPFGPEITSYLIKGAKFINNFGLSINWVDSVYCSLQPRSNKDYIGTEYLKELVKVNPLSNLYQLHLSGSNEESREKLDKHCVSIVYTLFCTSLKHLGNFFYWNLTNEEKRNMANALKANNCAIVLEEHLKNIKEEKLDVQKDYVDDRLTFSCQDPKSLISEQYYQKRKSLIPVFEANIGLHGFAEIHGIIPEEMSDSDLSFHNFDSDEEEDNDNYYDPIVIGLNLE